MTKAEFELWQTETARSTRRWTIDLVHNGLNGQWLLAYKGGTDGHFFEVTRDGTVRIGSYEGAIPHIGEAAFKVMHTYKCKDWNDACSRFFSAMGLQWLIEELCG